MTLISACGRLVEHKHAAEAGMKWFSKEYLGILAATSGLANDSKPTFVKALFTQPSDLFWSWEKTSSQTCKPWGKRVLNLPFFGPLLKRIPDWECFRNKTTSAALGWANEAQSVRSDLAELRQVKVFNMFRVSELGLTSSPDICCLSLTISSAEITLFIPLSGQEDSSALSALPAISFSDSTARWNLLTLHSCGSFAFGNFCFKGFLIERQGFFFFFLS